MLTLDSVSFAYGDTPVLQNISLALHEKSAVCFTAPSGQGKTTLLRLIAGLETPQSGTITRRDGLKTAVVFQENRLFPWMTVEENVAAVCPDGDVTPFLKAVELTEARNKYPDELSGGMQRRVALARALAYGGDLLLLDEPFTGLDPALRERIADVIRTQFANACIVLITHDADEAALLRAEMIPLETLAH